MDVKKVVKGKWKDAIMLILIALVLAIAVWMVYGENGRQQESLVNATTISKTDEEIKLTAFLSQIKGVGDVDVMIYKTETGETSVAIVCDGANDIHVQMDIREAVATALGTTQQAIKIYLKKFP